MKEEWRDVIGFNGKYKVSNLGNIKSFYHNKVEGKIKKQVINSHGYPAISVQIEGRKCRLRPVHRLVALAFLPSAVGKTHVNHIDGDKLNNEVNNLEWITHAENIKHGFKIGLYNNAGENNGRSVLTNEQAQHIRKIKETDGTSIQSLANVFGVSQTTIWKLLNNLTYKL